MKLVRESRQEASSVITIARPTNGQKVRAGDSLQIEVGTTIPLIDTVVFLGNRTVLIGALSGSTSVRVDVPADAYGVIPLEVWGVGPADVLNIANVQLVCESASALIGLNVLNDDVVIRVGQTRAIVAYANYADGSQRPVASDVDIVFASANAAVAAVNKAGVIVGVGEGRTVVSVQKGAYKSVVAVTVEANSSRRRAVAH
jgi:hypothetical protein